MMRSEAKSRQMRGNDGMMRSEAKSRQMRGNNGMMRSEAKSRQMRGNDGMIEYSLVAGGELLFLWHSAICFGDIPLFQLPDLPSVGQNNYFPTFDPSILP